MKYNIMTVINSDYFDFGKIFVNSFYDIIDLNNIHKLYVYDTGLSERDTKYLSVFPKLEIVPTQLHTRHQMLHDEDWRKNVYSKTAFLLQVIERDSLPTIMIDSDCLFLSNFFDLISERYDFIACQRDEKEAFSEYIASFFVVNSVSKAPEFIGAWREEMFFGTENHKESPALSRLIYKNFFNIGFLPEDLVSYTGRNINEQVRIVHMKSARELRTVEQRIHQSHLEKYTDKYLTPVPLMALEKDHQTVLQSLAHERSDTLPNLGPASGENLGEDVLSRVKDMSPQKRALLLQRLKKTNI